MWIFFSTTACVCVYVYGDDSCINRNTVGQQILLRPVDFELISTQVTWEMLFPVISSSYSQLMLNKKQLLILNVALVWWMNVQISMQITNCIQLRLAAANPAEMVKCMNL